MTDGMGSAWVRSRKDKPAVYGLPPIIINVIQQLTDRLAKEIDPSRKAEFKDGPYYDALDDLRALVGLEPTERP